MATTSVAELSFADKLRIEHACTRLALDYSHLADSRQMDAWSELFAPDAELVIMGNSQRGRAAIRGSLGDGNAAIATFHSNSNIRIDVVSPREARGDVGVTVFVAPVKDGVAQSADLSPMVIGKYSDVYREYDGRWLFARREFVPTMSRPQGG